MKEKDVLYFEEDDASQLGVNGKQVFFTKRINGKTQRNKIDDENETNILSQNKKEKENENEEIIINLTRNYNNRKEVNTAPNKNIKKRNVPQNKKSNNIKHKKKKKKKPLPILKILVVVLLIATATIFAFVSPIFRIQNIKVSGNTEIDSKTIESLSNLKIGDNIFQNNKTKIISNIKQEPYIDKVEIKRHLPSTIEINIKERKVQYQIKALDSYVYIDNQGYILEISNKEMVEVPIIIGMSTEQNDLLNREKLLDEDTETLNTLAKILNSAKSIKIDNLITNINVKDKEQYILTLSKEKKEIYLGDASNLADKMSYIEIILEKEKKNKGKIIINGDLNAGFKPYFRQE